MQTNLVQFKSVIQDFESFFHFNAGVSTEIAKLAVLDCLKWLGQIEDEVRAAKASQANQVAEMPVEQPPVTAEVIPEPQPAE